MTTRMSLDMLLPLLFYFLFSIVCSEKLSVYFDRRKVCWFKCVFLIKRKRELEWERVKIFITHNLIFPITIRYFLILICRNTTLFVLQIN